MASACSALRRVDHMGQHRPARQGLQHLGQVRLHAFALAGGQDDDGERHGRSLRPDLLLDFAQLLDRADLGGGLASSACTLAVSILSPRSRSASSARCLACSAAASSMSLARSAVSASTVTRCGWISIAPPPTREELLFARRRLHADFARLERRQQRRVTRRDADVAHDRGREHHRGFAREDLAFGADDVDVDGCHGRIAGYCSVFAFATASSMAPTM